MDWRLWSEKAYSYGRKWDDLATEEMARAIGCECKHVALLAHALGLGEAGEVQGVIKKWVFHDHPREAIAPLLLNELGDVLWYCNGICVLVDLPFEEIVSNYRVSKYVSYISVPHAPMRVRAVRYAVEMGGHAGVLQHAISSYAFTEDTLHVKAVDYIILEILIYCAALAEGFGSSLEQVAELNLKKLHERYPEGFTSERSINRKESKGKGSPF